MLEDIVDEVEEEEEEDDVEPEKRWEMERESIAMANMSATLQVSSTGPPPIPPPHHSSNFGAVAIFVHFYYFCVKKMYHDIIQIVSGSFSSSVDVLF